MCGTIREQSISDIKEAVQAKKEIISSIVAAHALSGCDSISSYHLARLKLDVQGQGGEKILDGRVGGLEN